MTMDRWTDTRPYVAPACGTRYILKPAQSHNAQMRGEHSQHTCGPEPAATLMAGPVPLYETIRLWRSAMNKIISLKARS